MNLGTATIDGVDTSAMSREQLEKFAHNLRNEMEREREERNFFQLERDKLRTFWEITRTQLGNNTANLCCNCNGAILYNLCNRTPIIYVTNTITYNYIKIPICIR